LSTISAASRHIDSSARWTIRGRRAHRRGRVGERDRSVGWHRRRPTRNPLAARRLSAVAAALILAGGYIHLCLYRNGYRFIPKIGVSFLLQSAASVAVAAALLLAASPVPVGRVFLTPGLAQAARLAGILLSAGTLGALALAHTPDGLFQFREIGLRPAPQTLVAIVAESLATLVLTAAVLTATRQHRPHYLPVDVHLVRERGDGENRRHVTSEPPVGHR
jgi:hypothetical protein